MALDPTPPNQTDFAAMKGAGSIFDLHVIQTPDDLPEELKCHVHDPEDGLFVWFHHPLYVTMFPIATPEPLMDVLARKEQMCLDAIRAGDFGKYLALVERAYRLHRLLELVWEGVFNEDDVRDTARFWSLAREMWTDAEHDETDPIWTDVMNAMPNRAFMTRSADRRALRAMPDTLTVWKGVHVPDGANDATVFDQSELGWSWTLREETADFFGWRFLQDGYQGLVVKAEVSQREITAYITDRGEQEVLIEPGTVRAHEWRVARAGVR